MFNFKKYPELIPYHKKYQKMSRKLIHLVNLSVDKDNESAGIKADKLSLDIDNVDEIYEKKIFEVFVNEKPKLLNGRTKKYENWDTVFGSEYEKVPEDNRGCLEGAVEEYGLYSFPPEYYDPNLTDKML